MERVLGQPSIIEPSVPSNIVDLQQYRLSKQQKEHLETGLRLGVYDQKKIPPIQSLFRNIRVWWVAKHEAGHSIVANHFGWSVTEKHAEENRGHIKTSPGFWNARKLWEFICIAVAGEMITGSSEGCGSDKAQARSASRLYCRLTRSSLSPETIESSAKSETCQILNSNRKESIERETAEIAYPQLRLAA
jgi:hypothetical protein